jgi:hypothetical protein
MLMKGRPKPLASSYLPLSVARTPLSINKMPPSHIPNGNTSLQKLTKNIQSKTESGFYPSSKTYGVAYPKVASKDWENK